MRPRLRRLLPVAMLSTTATLLASMAAVPLATADAVPSYPFRDPSLPVAARIDDLMSRLTTVEKISLLHQYEPAIPRLGIGVWKAGTEALHGVAWSTDYNDNGAVVTANATVFPQALGLASTWDPALIKKVGAAVGDEARGLHAQNPTLWGLNLWAPVVNLLRDPRWGRNEEGYSEDPTLTSAIATAYGSGIEGDDPYYLKAAPTLKHFLAYNNEVDRSNTSSNVPPRVLNDYDIQAFKPTLERGAATGVMASYNLLNGRPMTVSPLLDTARHWADRPLFNVSDAGAPYNLTGGEQYFATQAQADAALFKAGLDSFTADGVDPAPMIAAVQEAIAKGFMTMADVETADRHVLSLRFRLGEFDPDGGPYGGIDASALNTPEHRQLARQTADEAAVLLKNDKALLPLDASTSRKVAVVGPLENVLYTDWYSGAPTYKVTPLQGIKERLGAGATVTDSEGADRIALKDVATGKYLTTTGTTDADAVAATGARADAKSQFDVFDWGQGIVTLRNVANQKYLGYNFGPFLTRDDQPNNWFVQQQFKLEAQADGTYVIHYAGYETQETWFQPEHYVTIGTDGSMALGAATAAGAAHFSKTTVRSGLAAAVAAAKGADTAVVVVGSMPFINGREAHDRTTMALAAGQERLVRAVMRANPHTLVVLENSYPDTITWEQQNVPAILWTTHAGQETGHAIADVLFGDYNPTGRLTQTWYRSEADLPGILDYDISKSNETYLYFKGTPLYPFGYGLSYSTYRYSDIRTSARNIDAAGRVDVTVRVTNTGASPGTDVVQLYTRQRTSRDKAPLKQLRGFARVSLAPGQSKDVTLTLRAADLAHWDVTRSRMVVEKSTYDLLVGASADDIRVRSVLGVAGERIPARDLSQLTRAENFDAYSAGIRLTDTSKAQGTSIGATAGGQWVEYADAALGRRPSTFTARVANPGAVSASIKLHLDSPHGPLVATAQVLSTGGVYRYTTVTAPLIGVSGRHAVFLVLGAGVRLATFSLN